MTETNSQFNQLDSTLIKATPLYWLITQDCGITGLKSYSPTPQRSDDAVLAKPVQAFLRCVGTLEHIQAYWAHQFAVQAARGHCYLCVVCDGLLWGAMELVEAELCVKDQF